VPLLWLVAAVHEAGHLLAGRIVGFRFVLFVVGPLRIERPGNRVRVGWNRDFTLGSGVAVCAPVHTRQLRLRMAATDLGGPIASLVFGLLLLRYGDMPEQLGLPALAKTLLVIVFNACGVFSLLTGFLLNVVPLPLGSRHRNDIQKLLLLVRPGAQGDRATAQLALFAAAMAGQRPREYDPTWLQAATGLQDGSAEEAVGHQYAYQSALDRGDIQAAGQHLDRALALKAQLPVAFVPALLMEAAYYTALYRGDAATARAYLEQAKSGRDNSRVTWLRAEAAVLKAEGDAESARMRVSEALEVLAAAGEPVALYQRECLEAVVGRESGL
jgi:hypothetical protein